MGDSSLEQIRAKTKVTIQSWNETCGLAPEAVTGKLDAAMFNWMSDLTDSLDIWIAKSLDMTDGKFNVALKVETKPPATILSVIALTHPI